MSGPDLGQFMRDWMDNVWNKGDRSYIRQKF